MRPLIVVTGTGTNIGKTHVACALLHAASALGHQVVGVKPVESGLDGASPSDAERLAAASSFHVKHVPGLRLKAALSPHLAAELEGASLDWSEVTGWVNDTRQHACVLVEMAGGLFSPLSRDVRNVDVIAALSPTMTLLLAPDRLGVLHDVGATVTAARSLGCMLDAIGLIATHAPDASADRNARELAHFVDVPILGTWPRGPANVLSSHEVSRRAVARWLQSA